MTEGKLAKWLIKEGDTVKAGDILAEIETDKATMEFEATDEGVIETIMVAEGTEGVAVNRSEEHTSELQSLMRSSYAVFCLKKKNQLVITSKKPTIVINS